MWRISGRAQWLMMTSLNGNISRVTGPLWGESIGHRWISLTKSSDADLWCFLWSSGLGNNRDADDLRRCRAHYDVTVVWQFYCVAVKNYDGLKTHPYEFHMQARYRALHMKYIQISQEVHTTSVPCISIWFSWHFMRSFLFFLWHS